MNSPEKAVLGLSGNIDYELKWDQEVIEELIELHNITREELSTDIDIDDERKLLISMLAFLELGQGGERYVASPDIIETFSDRFNKKITLGGSALRAAIAMGKMGVSSTVHLVENNDDVRRLLPENCKYITSSREDAFYPHLIIQYKRGTKIKLGDEEIVADKSNRIIYVNDPPNQIVMLSDDLAQALPKCKVFMISGLNAIQDMELLKTRLEEIEDYIDMMPKDSKVFFEDACYHKDSFSRLVRDTLAPKVDIYSLNEDELQSYIDRKVDLLDAEDVYKSIKELSSNIPAANIAVHTRYWALIFGRDSARLEPALRGGVTMATTRYLFGDDFDKSDYCSTEALPCEEEGDLFAKRIMALSNNTICCIPSYDANSETPTTIGLGDSFVGGFILKLLPLL